MNGCDAIFHLAADADVRVWLITYPTSFLFWANATESDPVRGLPKQGVFVANVMYRYSAIRFTPTEFGGGKCSKTRSFRRGGTLPASMPQILTTSRVCCLTPR